MGELNTTPTGCPGPIPGTKVWRCDGENCVYGAAYYASCRQAIAERGYTLRISSTFVEEVAEAAELIRQNVQGQLEEERIDKERIIKKADEMDTNYRARLATQMFKTDAQQNLADEFANLYYKALVDKSVAVTKLGEDIDSQCEHCATLLQRIAELEDELLYYKQLEAQYETTNNSCNIDAGNSANGDSVAVPDASSNIGTVTK